MKQRIKWCLVLASFVLLCHSPVDASFSGILTFDDLSGTLTAVPNGYNGFNWSNVNYMNAVNYMYPSGYKNGMVSANNVAYNSLGNSAGISSATPFTFNGAYFTAAWNNGLNIEIQGLAGGKKLYDRTITVNTTSPTYSVLNYQNIDTLTLSSSGGTGSFYGSGTQFAMDNVIVNQTVSTPIPGTLGLLGSGLAGLAAIFRRRK